MGVISDLLLIQVWHILRHQGCEIGPPEIEMT